MCVQGMVRGIQQGRNDLAGDSALGIVLHGDTSFGSYGAVYEYLALSQTRGFSSGGTIHIVINNRIGFTNSNSLDTRSAMFCTDIVKTVGIPVFHVSADEPDMVIAVGRLALYYRTRFKKDVVIDLVCYRRRGHTEIDEPAVTQPNMYASIHKHPTVVDLYDQCLTEQRQITEHFTSSLSKEYQAKLEAETSSLVFEQVNKPDDEYSESDLPGATVEQSPLTAVSAQRLKKLCEHLTELPENFYLHPLVDHIRHNRIAMTQGKKPWDWAFAELLAYASLLDDGYGVRLVGKDSERGTFSQRHAAYHNVRSGDSFMPLSQIGELPRRFAVINATASDHSVLAYEYGYSVGRADTLVVWEAQFPDAISVAQLIIDQLISMTPASRSESCGLTLLVPYGQLWKGWGNTTGHLERFLASGAANNFQIAVPSNSAQLFHLLRRQMINNTRMPLLIMFAPRLFKMEAAASSLDAFTSGFFKPVIDSSASSASTDEIVLCSGDVYYDLITREGATSLIFRVEQLRPFPHKEIEALLARFPSVKRITWQQREAANLWAWHYVQDELAGYFPEVPRTMRGLEDSIPAGTDGMIPT
jgi:2-oxoglutarate dehydrogenase E1 component